MLCVWLCCQPVPLCRSCASRSRCCVSERRGNVDAAINAAKRSANTTTREIGETSAQHGVCKRWQGTKRCSNSRPRRRLHCDAAVQGQWWHEHSPFWSPSSCKQCVSQHGGARPIRRIGLHTVIPAAGHSRAAVCRRRCPHGSPLLASLIHRVADEHGNAADECRWNECRRQECSSDTSADATACSFVLSASARRLHASTASLCLLCVRCTTAAYVHAAVWHAAHGELLSSVAHVCPAADRHAASTATSAAATITVAVWRRQFF